MPFASRIAYCAFGEDIAFMLFSGVNSNATCPCPLPNAAALERNGECVNKPIVLPVPSQPFVDSTPFNRGSTPEEIDNRIDMVDKKVGRCA